MNSKMPPVLPSLLLTSRSPSPPATSWDKPISVDPAMRHVVGERAKDKTAASVSQMGRFETEILTQAQNLKALMNHPGQWVDEVHKHKPIKEIILDIDSSDSPTFGRQEGSAYNGHFGYTCYHPLFVFNQFGDIERALLRHGNVYSSDDWKSALEPVVERYQDKNLVRYFRGDSTTRTRQVVSLPETTGERPQTDFVDNFSYKRWRKICKEAGLADLKFHDLRKTFGSMLAQNGISTAVTQKLLEHSSPNLTNKVYTNVDPVLRYAVEQLPVGEWL